MKTSIVIFSFMSMSLTSLAEGSSYNCSIEYNKANLMVDAEGMVADEVQFLKATEVAIDACKQMALTQDYRLLIQTLSSARSLCDQAANQRSILYHGTCYLKVADLGRIILGQ